MKIAQGKYTVHSSLGSSESFVKLAHSSYLNAKVALKLEDSKRALLLKEYQNLSILKGLAGVPDVLDYGREAHYSYMATELLGTNLRYHESSRNLSFLATMMYQSVETLKKIHRAGFVHGNLTPNHFVVGKGHRKHFLYVVDFSRAQRFKIENITGSPDILPDPNHEFCSLNVSFGGKCYPRDDLESLIYCLIWLYKRSLPWIPTDVKFNKPHIIKNFKLAVNLNQICSNCPQKIRQILSYCRGLKSSDKLDYNHIKSLLKDFISKTTQKESLVLYTRSDLIKHNKRRNQFSDNKKSTSKLDNSKLIKSDDLLTIENSLKFYFTDSSTRISEVSNRSQASSYKSSAFKMDLEDYHASSNYATSRNKYPELSIALRNTIKTLKIRSYV